MADELTAPEALRLLIEASTSDPDLRLALAAIASRAGCSSIAEFARENHEQIVMIAETQLSLGEDDEIGMAKIDEIRMETQK